MFPFYLGQRTHVSFLLEQIHTLLISCLNNHIFELQDGSSKVIGAHVRDRSSGTEMDVYAKLVINCSGAFIDSVRRTSNPE
jgi:L-2-hydroxyglutarate oxidase LhgO